MSDATLPILEVTGLTTGYDRKKALFGVDIRVAEGEFVAVVGHNGAGKTTLLRSCFGLLRPWRGMVNVAGRDVTALSPEEHVKVGMAFVPQGRAVFADLTVAENLEVGAHRVRDRREIRRRMDAVLSLFPVLAGRAAQRAGTMSGGEQQMVALGIALMQTPRLLLLDEPSLGLAPLVVQRMLAAVARINREMNVAVVLVEQNVRGAASVASRVYVLRTGRVTRETGGQEIATADTRSLL